MAIVGISLQPVTLAGSALVPANTGVRKNAHCAITCSRTERGGLMLSSEKPGLLLWCECCHWKTQLSCFTSWLVCCRVREQSSECSGVLTGSRVLQQMCLLPWPSLRCSINFCRTGVCREMLCHTWFRVTGFWTAPLLLVAYQQHNKCVLCLKASQAKRKHALCACIFKKRSFNDLLLV